MSIDWRTQEAERGRRCPQCAQEGRRSRVYLEVAQCTALAGQTFWDEEARWHDHDPNTTTEELRCSNGHRWRHEVRPSCFCGWPHAPQSLSSPP